MQTEQYQVNGGCGYSETYSSEFMAAPATADYTNASFTEQKRPDSANDEAVAKKENVGRLLQRTGNALRLRIVNGTLNPKRMRAAKAFQRNASYSMSTAHAHAGEAQVLGNEIAVSRGKRPKQPANTAHKHMRVRPVFGAMAKCGARKPLHRHSSAETRKAYSNTINEQEYLSDLSETVDRLKSWGNWAQEHAHAHRCGSAERYYNGGALVDRAAAAPITAPAAALSCERAWRKLPEPFKTIIHRRYIMEWPAGYVARYCRIQIQTFPVTHRHAVLMMRNTMK